MQPTLKITFHCLSQQLPPNLSIAYVQIITIFLSMLDWCRNLQPVRENNAELTLIPVTSISQPLSTRNLLPPKFVEPAQRRINSESRKGIKTHFARMTKLDKETQTTFQEGTGKILRECSTQTIDPIVIHPLGCRKNSMSCSRQQSPLGRLDRTMQPKGEPCATERTLMEGSKGTLDCRNDLNRETKASFNLLESQEQAYRPDDHSYHHLHNVQSYHLPTYQAVLTVPHQPLMRPRMPHRQGLASQRMVESIRNSISEEHESVSFSQKYKTMLRNVESEFKLSEKKHSERKIRYTPEKRILFHERQTIVSKYGDSHQEERSLRVEESLVYDRDVRAGFIPVGRPEVCEGFSLSLGVEKTAGVMVSIKEVPVRRMEDISEELLIYREMEERRVRVEGVLELYQTQIDRDLYLFIKQPYVHTLAHHLPNADLSAIETQIRSILETIEQHGFTLKEEPRVLDFVVCLDRVKLHNAAIFEFGQRKKIEIESAIAAIKDQILQRLL